MRLYLSGPMTGLADFNHPAFREAAAVLREQGHVVVSPAELPGDKCDPWEVWMRKALTMLLTCEAVAFLPGWQASRGATLEHHVAQALGMQRFAYYSGKLRPLTRAR
ncbi:DUF4406 domain-containing protein [Alicyclobacillus macrosporangiidus]|uniref:DUF4406 domain-containing protein n=1 Tax=Alicyclobacillus macrosporangiidus TaxID=392015 RepID=UPI00055563A3|nr:DUF4406 domain-containing protein [Alicyclobacillus macrosporangiidus]